MENASQVTMSMGRTTAARSHCMYFSASVNNTHVRHKQETSLHIYRFICWTRISTARLWASSSSTLASCMTASPTFRRPSAVRFELVMCLTKEPRLTPEYCLA